MSVWIIRAARESDMDQLMEMRLALQEHLERRNGQIWRLSADGREGIRNQLVQLLFDEDVRVLVAVDGSEAAIGMAVGRVRKRNSHVPTISGSIELLFVLETWRRRGVGSELVKRLCRFFAARNADDISVRYVVGNSEATRFWNKVGFQPRIITAGTDLRHLERKVTEA